VTATGARIAAAVTAAGCLWPDAPCPCAGDCPVDVAGALAGHVGDEGTDKSFAREIDRMDWPDGEVPK
jgi:hypothetical protein